jgi:hypothetical protein
MSFCDQRYESNWDKNEKCGYVRTIATKIITDQVGLWTTLLYFRGFSVRIPVGTPSSLHRGTLFRLSHDYVLPNHFQFICHLEYDHCRAAVR